MQADKQTLVATLNKLGWKRRPDGSVSAELGTSANGDVQNALFAVVSLGASYHCDVNRVGTSDPSFNLTLNETSARVLQDAGVTLPASLLNRSGATQLR